MLIRISRKIIKSLFPLSNNKNIGGDKMINKLINLISLKQKKITVVIKR